MVRSNGQAILYNVTSAVQGPVYFTTASGATIVGAMLISLQQIVGSFNTGSTDFIFRNTTTTTTTITTTYTFNPTITPYITSNAGQSFSAGFIAALVQALTTYNSNQQQSNTIVLIYSNGQVVDTTVTTSTTFFGPIYFITYSGQQLSQSALFSLQQIMNTLSQQWGVLYYNNSPQQPNGPLPDNNDPNCARYVGNTNNCAACSNRFYLSSRTNRCTAVNNQCNTFDQSNGLCLSCYQGYTLSNGDCYILVTQGSFDPNCKTADSNGVCQECYQGYFYSSTQSKCIIANTLCRTITATGTCDSCYTGYILQNGNCRVQQNTGVGNCRNFSNGVCYECSNGYIQSSGKCLPVNPQCRTYSNKTGECLTCYPGYIPSNGNCIIGGGAPSGDPSCRAYDQYGNCRECSERFYKSNGRCAQVSDFCNTFDRNNGKCLTCYRGYTLQNGDCYKMLVVQQPQQPAQPPPQLPPADAPQGQSTTITRQQGSADLQFGVVTIPVDTGTFSISTLPGAGDTSSRFSGTSGSSSTTSSTTSSQGSTGTFPGFGGNPPATNPNAGNQFGSSQQNNQFGQQNNRFGGGVGPVLNPATGQMFGSTSSSSSTGVGGVVVTKNTTVTTITTNQGSGGQQWGGSTQGGSNSGSSQQWGNNNQGGASGAGSSSSQWNTGSSGGAMNQWAPGPSSQTNSQFNLPSGSTSVTSSQGSNNSGQQSFGKQSFTQQSSSSTSSSTSGGSSGSVLNCRTYSDDATCADCNDGFLLFANFCLPQ